MPWGVAAAVGGSLVSSALSPSGGGGSGGMPYYTPTGLSSADQAWQDMLARQTGIVNAGNPYTGGYQTAANQAGATYGQLYGLGDISASRLNAQAGASYGAVPQLQNIGMDLYNLGRDPQGALYNRTQQQLTDQINAGQALRGLGTSDVGGQEYNQAMSNFNIDWQNQQLQRALQGAQGLSSLYGQAGQYSQLGGQQTAQALDYYSRLPGYRLAGGQLPYQAAQDISNAQLGQAQGIQGQIIPYLNYGQGAVQSAYATGAQQAGAAGALAGQGISGLGSAFGNMFGSGGGGYGYSGQGSLFGGTGSDFGSGAYGTSPVSGYNTGVQYGMGTNYGFGY